MQRRYTLAKLVAQYDFSQVIGLSNDVKSAKAGGRRTAIHYSSNHWLEIWLAAVLGIFPPCQPSARLVAVRYSVSATC